MTDARIITFRILKPPCVALSQVALSYKAKKANGSDVVQALRTVLAVLEGVDQLDLKLADYAFFPLSYVFREIATLPSEAAQLSLKCLDVLIRKGWSLESNPEICKQLVVLLSFILSGSSQRDSLPGNFTEETIALALDCLKSLAKNAPVLFLGFCQTPQDEAVPVIGNAIDIILTVLKNDLSHNVQLAAMEAILAIVSCLKYERILKDFLPGIVSNLTQTIQPSSKTRRLSRVIVTAMEALEYIMGYTLGDQFQAIETIGEHSSNANATDKSWMVATSGQVRLALANIIGLRYHQKEDVLRALFHLCLTILRRCKVTLPESADILLETAVMLCSSDIGADWQTENQSLNELVGLDGNLVDILKTMVHSLLSSLPTMLQTVEIGNLKKRLALISTAYNIAAHLGIDMEIIDDNLLSSLQESVKTSLQNSRGQPSKLAVTDYVTNFSDLALISESKEISEFESESIFRKDGFIQLDYLRDFIQSLLSEQSQARIKHSLVDNLALASPQEKMVSMWLFLRFMAPANTAQLEEFFLFSATTDASDDECLQIAYSNALESVLVSPAENKFDWRHQSVALEVIALKARRERNGFQPELVDTLFPIVERIGVVEPGLRQQAIVCLNVLAETCGARTVGELIVQNVDYLINSLALKLNAFDINPITPRVLVMMVELCGSDLIPYLDDILDSLFSALAMFHGYPNVVDGLFSVLESIVKQAAKPSETLIETASKTSYSPIALGEAINLLKTLKDTSLADSARGKKGDNHARTSSTTPEQNEIENASHVETDIGEQIAEGTEDVEKRQVSKSYEMVQSIIRVGQFYLTHSSATLRRRLLILLANGFTILSGNEDEFLPLINDIWPVTFRRLLDPQPEVSLAAMETLSVIFKFVGDFVSSRLEDEWPRIKNLSEGLKVKQALENKGRGGRGLFSPSSRLWDGFVDFLVNICVHLSITAEMEDDLIEMLEPPSRSRPDIRAILETLNGDALWLVQEKQQRAIEHPPYQSQAPKVPGFNFKVIDMSQI